VVTSYRVPAQEGTAMLEERRSRFLATVTRVEDESGARAVVEAARREHWDARHHCSAFVLGPRSEVARSSDDGEPAGSAGAPMLEVLPGAEVSDAVAVVTRWFGGVLLGAGGLVRAYGDAVRAALDDAGVLERQLVELVAVTVPHALAGRLENDLRSRGVTVREVRYADRARLVVGAPAGEALEPLVAGLTAGAAVVEPAGSEWVDTTR
jgi:uncharacterized YigZ family protein